MVETIVRFYKDASAQRDDDDRRRREIVSRLERIRELYKWGDMTREAYVAERDKLEAELATLQGATDQAAVLVQAADLLRNLATAWGRSTPEQQQRPRAPGVPVGRDRGRPGDRDHAHSRSSRRFSTWQRTTKRAGLQRPTRTVKMF